MFAGSVLRLSGPKSLWAPLVACLTFTLIVRGGRADAATVPAGFSDSTFVENANLSSATGMAWASDGSNRLFVIRKAGEVRVVQNGGDPTPWAVVPNVYTNSECGLIGICFDPDFVNNRYVYLFVTVSATEQQIIRYTDENGVGGNPTVLVQGLPTTGNNHDGGAIGIGPDGHLYWAIGDLGNGTGVDANLTSLAAKMGRANRFTGAPVPDNPFADGPGPNNEYIWARGFRNPFTMTFHPVTGKLWLNVVGTSYEQIFVVGRGDHGGYNDYENNQPAGFLPPTIVYRTNGTDSRPLQSAIREGGVATFTTNASHRFRLGQQISITGVADTTFNSTGFISEVVSSTSFRMPWAGPDGSSAGGAANTAAIGGCVTGGTFYDSTLFPAEFRENFFFGDYNSGTITRATLASHETVTSVSGFATGASGVVDLSVGPDGALYYVHQSTGRVGRIAPSTVAPGLLVHPTTVRVQEGGDAVFTVRLAEAPAANVTVNVARRAGSDPEVNTSGDTLVFTPENWNVLQSVTVHAEFDVDRENGSALFDISAGGLPTESVTALEIDGIAQTALAQDVLYFTNGPVPGEGAEVTFKNFGPPTIDGSDVGFRTILKQGNLSVPALFGRGGVIVRKGDDAADTAGKFLDFKDPVFMNGAIAFVGKLSRAPGITANNDEGIWTDHGGGGMRALALEGAPAPNIDGAVFRSFTALGLRPVNGPFFSARLKRATGARSAAVTGANDDTLWQSSAAGLTLILREGLPLPGGLLPDRLVKSFQVLTLISDSGDQRRGFDNRGLLRVLVNFSDRTQAIVRTTDAGPLELETQTGDTTTVPGGETLTTLGVPAGLNDVTAFKGRLKGSAAITPLNDTALFVGSGLGAFSGIFREGDPAPNSGGASFADFGIPVLASTQERLVFGATLRTRTGDPVVTGATDGSLWYGSSGDLHLVAREGSPAPGTSAAFARFVSFAVHPETPLPYGFAFTATLKGKATQVTSRSREGLWALNQSGDPILLQRTGDQADIPGRGSVPILALHALKPAVGTAGQGRSTNATGKIVYKVALQRAGEAIVLVQLPWEELP